MNDYRTRIYGAYVRSTRGVAEGVSLADFAPRRPFLAQIVRRHFPAARDARILELGCGPGALLHVAQSLGYTRMRGVDRSPEQVAVAHRLGIQGISEGDVLEVLGGIEPQSHDAIVAFDVIEHFTKPEILNFVDLVHRALKPGGRFIVHTCNGEGPFPGASLYRDFTHEMAFTRDSIRQLFLASGWTAVTCHEDRPVPHGVKSAARLVLWHVFRALLRLYLAAEKGDTGRDAIFSQDFLAVAVK
jgi:2-polyprenyl-3-methyl-5-hydroxy-6-metoxy-1,4-benzoquinol methylase